MDRCGTIQHFLVIFFSSRLEPTERPVTTTTIITLPGTATTFERDTLFMLCFDVLWLFFLSPSLWTSTQLSIVVPCFSIWLFGSRVYRGRLC